MFPSSTLITGGLGYIGSNLTILLAENGIATIIIDSLRSEYGDNLHNI
jgi:UDP-glucose 4-epimerase